MCVPVYTVCGSRRDDLSPPPLRAFEAPKNGAIAIGHCRLATSFLALVELTKFLSPNEGLPRGPADEQPGQHPCLSGNGALEHWVWRLRSHSKCAPCSTTAFFMTHGGNDGCADLTGPS
jgi:hypothetical protein